MRVLGAVRLSAMTDETTSPERQREQITGYASLHGHEVVEITEDLDVSGAVAPFDRDDLGPWLTQAARMRQWDAIVVAKFDRLSRSVADYASLIKWCEANGKTIISVSEGLDFSSAAGRMFAQLLVMFAEFERERISERRAEAAVKLRSQARWGGGRVPYGYAVQDTGHGYVLVPNPTERSVIQRAAGQVIAGKSVNAVCAGLNSDGVLSQSGKSWSAAVMLRILRNPVIRGYVVTDGEVVTGSDGMPVTRQGLIDDDTWKALQAALNAGASPGSGICKDAALLLQLAFCAVCYQPMYAMRRKGRGYGYYQCRTSRTGGKCPSASVRMAELESCATDALLARFGTEPWLERVVIPAEDHVAELATVHERLADLKAQVVAGRLSAAMFADVASLLEARQAGLEAMPAREESERWEPTGETFAEHWHGQDDAGKRRMLQALSLRIMVDSRGKDLAVSVHGRRDLDREFRLTAA